MCNKTEDNQKEENKNFKKLSGNRKVSSMMVGMSPIINFRPLNRIALKNSSSQLDSQFSTPVLAGDKITHDSNSSISSFKNPYWIEEESKIDEVIKILQSAKQELDVLENLKTLSQEIFNLVN